MPQTMKIPVQGLAVTTDATLTRIAVFGPIPTEGAWNITGAVTATGLGGSGGSRKSVTYWPNFNGISTGGAAVENDTYCTQPAGTVPTAALPGMVVQPQDAGAGQGFAIAQPKLTITNNTIEMEVAGIAETTVNWVFNLDLKILSLP
jgi:hypothetical protein